MIGTVYVGRAAALRAARLDHLPELGARLHPDDVAVLIDDLRDSAPRARVCFNPHTLDHLRPEEASCVVCVRLVDGAALRPLSNHPAWPEWRDVMSVGEFWASVGEGWVAP